MKRIIFDPKDTTQTTTNINEIEIIKQLNHPNLIQYYKSFIHKSKLCIIMEYADGGDLSAKIEIHSKQNRLIPENDIWNLFLQLCNGLSYLHSKNIIHRDIKSQNVFLTKNGVVKLGDFGISKILKNSDDFAHTSLGTPFFLSPEICQGKSYNFKSDVWMLGCVLYEMAALKKPFSGDNLPMIMNNIITKDIPPIPSFYSENLRNLIKLLLNKDMNERPTVAEIMAYPFVKDKILLNKVKITATNSQKKHVVFYYNDDEKKTERLETERDNYLVSSSPKVSPLEILKQNSNYFNQSTCKKSSSKLQKRNSQEATRLTKIITDLEEHPNNSASSGNESKTMPQTPSVTNFSPSIEQTPYRRPRNNTICSCKTEIKKRTSTSKNQTSAHISHANSSILATPKSNILSDYYILGGSNITKRLKPLHKEITMTLEGDSPEFKQMFNV